jgi:hypothetical protein
VNFIRVPQFVLFTKSIRVIKSKRMRWAGHMAYTVKRRTVYKILVGKPEWKRPLSRHRWEDNIKLDLSKIWFGDMDWTQLAQDMDWWCTTMNPVINLHIPQHAGNFLAS